MLLSYKAHTKRIVLYEVETHGFIRKQVLYTSCKHNKVHGKQVLYTKHNKVHGH